MPRQPPATSVVVALVALPGLVGLVGCAPDGPASAGPEERERPARVAYVALGDSYTAAPMVGDTEIDTGCFRSDANYPALLAERLDLDLTDVSCGGATTRSLTHEQTTLTDTRRPPQLDALSEDTDLVTLSVGANDFNLFGNLIQQCVGLAATDPGRAPCATLDSEGGGSDVERTIDRIRGRVLTSIGHVADRAPNARVFVVGYPQLVPGDGTCAELPLAEGDYPLARRANQLLDQEIEGAATDAGVEYVDVFAATEGHDICGADPWIADGSATPPAGVPYHPLAAEQELISDLLAEQLG